jgi:hypothetical protein
VTRLLDVIIDESAFELRLDLPRLGRGPEIEDRALDRKLGSCHLMELQFVSC